MMLTGLWIQRGTYRPVRTDDLRPEMNRLIGQEFYWRYAGTSAADEPYPGQHRWLLEPMTDIDGKRIYEPFDWWVPDEDIVFSEPQPAVKAEG